MTKILELLQSIIQKAIATLGEIDTLKQENATLKQSLAEALANDAADAQAIAEAQAVAASAKAEAEASAAALTSTQEQLQAALDKIQDAPEIESAVTELAGLFQVS